MMNIQRLHLSYCSFLDAVRSSPSFRRRAPPAAAPKFLPQRPPYFRAPPPPLRPGRRGFLPHPTPSPRPRPRWARDWRLAGQTKDGRLCAVYDPMGPSIHPSNPSSFDQGWKAVWIRRTNDDGFKGWMLGNSIPLQEIVRRGFKEANVDCHVNVRAIITCLLMLGHGCIILQLTGWYPGNS